MVLRRLTSAAMVAGAVTGVFAGCVAQQQGAAVGKTDAGPTFRNPAEFRPADASIQPPPMPATPVAAAPAPAAVKPLAGPWAPPVKSRAWRYIVIHHSASPTGNAALFDREHRDKGWDELGYHFVVDNGRGGTDGAIEMGPRWLKQKWGAHAKTPDNRYNDFGIGVCFVGNFEQGKPTAKQLATSARLVAWLMRTYDIPAANVIGHEDTGRSTLCPGKFLSVARVRTLAGQALAGGDVDASDFEDAPVSAGVALSVERELLRAR